MSTTLLLPRCVAFKMWEGYFGGGDVECQPLVSLAVFSKPNSCCITKVDST